MKRAVWVDKDQPMELNQLKRYGIADPYFDGTEARLTPEFLEAMKLQASGTPGIYMAWNWFPQTSGDQFANRCHQRLREIGWSGNPPLCADIEKGHGLDDDNFVDYLMSFAKRWRELRPKRETHITIEGKQGGLFRNRFQDVVWLNNSGIKLVPQLYTGDMTPHGAGVLQDLMDYGFSRGSLCSFYDGAIVQEPWDGFIFTQQRLP